MWPILERLLILLVAANVIFIAVGLHLKGFSEDDKRALKAYAKRFMGAVFRRHS